MIAAGLFGILMTLMVGAFSMGSKTWRKADEQAEVLQNLQVVSTRLSREMERSVYQSLSIASGNDALSFLSALDPNGQFAMDAGGNTQWQKYIIFYYDSGADEVLFREVPLVGGSAEIMTPGPIESYNDGTGAKPLANYLNSGRPLARGVTQFLVGRAGAQLVTLQLAAEKQFGTRKPTTASLRSSVHLRNVP